MNHFETLKSTARGSLIEPDDPRYDSARAVYNAMHDRRPAAILCAVDSADVLAGVNCARENGLSLAVRGGGHSVPGYGSCDDGLVIDLSGIRHVLCDPDRAEVVAGGGCTLGDVDHATHAYGLAVPSGTVSSTGLAGLTLGGGMGHLSRSCGLSIDNLKAIELVTADGAMVRCDHQHDKDLFWALRGGGGNFGVVTSFHFRAHRLQSVFAGPTFFEPEADVFRNYEAWINDAAAELNALIAVVLTPPAPFVPEAHHRQPGIAVLACWSGDEARDETLPDEIAALGTVRGQALWRMPYPQVNTFFDELLPPGLRHYWKASVCPTFNEEVIAAHLEIGLQVDTLEGGNFIFPLTGACLDVADDDTAFMARGGLANAISGIWRDSAGDEQHMSWVRDYYAALEPWSQPGAYINFMSADQSAGLGDHYGAKYQRLREIKRHWDPQNLFCNNQNIPPA